MDVTRIISLFATLIVTAVSAFVSCDERNIETVISDTVAQMTEKQSEAAEIVKNGESDYSIFVAADAETYVKSAAEELSASIYKKTLVYVPVTDKVSDKSIFINYDGSERHTDIGDYGYSITEKDGCVYINGAYTDSLICALSVFDDSFIKTAENGGMTVPTDTNIVKKSDERLILADYIDMGIEVETELKTVGLYDGVTVDSKRYYIAQGAATDGEYIYVVLKHSEYEGVVVKMDYSGQLIGISKPYDFGHANDMTYDTDKELIVLVHGTSYENTKNGNGNGRRFSLLDPATLDLVYTTETGFDIGKEAGAITYNTETGIYTIGRLCTYYHQFTMNDDYTLSYSFSTTRGSAEEEGRVGYTGQGLGGDNRYVYFPYSGIQTGAAGNLLVVYDNFGKYVTTIEIDSSMESESLFYNDGRYYICFNWGSGYIHELMYKPVYSSETVEFDEIDQELTAVSDEVAVYSDTSLSSAVIETAAKGDSFSAVGFSADGKWYKIRLPYGGCGYIESGSLMPSEYAVLVEYSIETKVKAGTAEVYRIPYDFFNDPSQVLFTLTSGTPVTVTGKVEGTSWVRVTADGKNGFMIAMKLETIDWSKVSENSDN